MKKNYLCHMTAKNEEFRIELSCDSPQWWRYNVAMMCGCFDEQNAPAGFVSAQDTIADVGSGLCAPPENYSLDRRSILTAPACDHIVLYLYVIPHTLPTDRNVEAGQPLEARLRVSCHGRELRNEKIGINQWSGISTRLTVKGN